MSGVSKDAPAGFRTSQSILRDAIPKGMPLRMRAQGVAKPVSYTHLDVYKRQILYMLADGPPKSEI